MLRSCVLICLLLPTFAQAATWSDFAEAFPVFPCVDGWSGCVRAGEEISPDLRVSDDGVLRRATDRLDWADLSATPSFDPWGGLSIYVQFPDEEVEQVAVVSPPPVERTKTVRPPVAERSEPAAVVEEQPANEIPIVEVVNDKVPVEQTPEENPEIVPVELTRPRAELPNELAVVSCDDLIALEVPAMMGTLDDNHIGCLESALVVQSSQTAKRNISLVLIKNAWRSDKRRWETLVRRHLNDIDRSDPDIAYSYAAFLNKKGVGRSADVLKWSSVALENKTRWSGPNYVKRVYSLHKLRTQAAQRLWKASDKRYTDDPSEGGGEDVERWRNQTKVEARDWYEYAHEAQRDTTAALQFCMSAAGAEGYCTGG